MVSRVSLDRVGGMERRLPLLGGGESSLCRIVEGWLFWFDWSFLRMKWFFVIVYGCFGYDFGCSSFVIVIVEFSMWCTWSFM